MLSIGEVGFGWLVSKVQRIAVEYCYMKTLKQVFKGCSPIAKEKIIGYTARAMG